MTEPRHERYPLASGVELHTVHWGPADGGDPELPPWLLVHGIPPSALLAGERFLTLPLDHVVKQQVVPIVGPLAAELNQ